MKIQSFGCSFLSGEELQSPDHTWPAILASRHSIMHENHASSGVGNLYILEKILSHATQESVVVVNWTYIDRFDFCVAGNEKWQTLRPALDHPCGPFYFQRMHGQYRDMLTSLIYIHTAIDFLTSRQIPFVMTYMDDLLFEQVDPNWHDPRAITELQRLTLPNMTDFAGQDFLSWSKHLGHAVSDNWHPLDAAHEAAADFLFAKVSTLIGR